MTVSTTSNRITYTGNGSTTVFAFPYKFIATADIVVYVAGVLVTSGFTVGAPSDAGANITFSAAPANLAAIIILSNPSQLQSTSLPSTGPFPAKTVETALDKLTLLIQRLSDLLGRSLTLSDSDSTATSTIIPPAVASSVLGWNNTGTAIQNYDAGALGVAISYANWATQTFNGTGAQTAFVLTADAGVASNCDVSVGGVAQTPNINFSYTASSKTITFLTGAPVSGTNNISVRYGQALPQGTVPALGVDTAQLVDGSVTTAKIAALAVTTAKFDSAAKAPLSTLADSATTVVATGLNSKIQPVTASVAASALTCTLNPTTLDFRSSSLSSGAVNTRTIAAALSVVVPSTATLGTISATQSRLVLLALDNAGTVELAVVNIAGGNNLDETTLISTTAIAGGSNTANAIYSTTARTGVPFRVVGYIESTQATAGTWATTPSTIQGMGGNALAAMSSFGYGQTWQAVTRSSGVTYYNTTGKPIFLAITSNAASAVSVTVNGLIVANTLDNTTNVQNYLSVVIPNFASYSNTYSVGTNLKMLELR